VPERIARMRCSEVLRLESEERYSGCAKGPSTSGGSRAEAGEIRILVADEIPSGFLGEGLAGAVAGVGVLEGLDRALWG